MTRAHYIGVPQIFDLNAACRSLTDAFGPFLFLVGSSLDRRDFRDVDVRCMLEDADFARMFPGVVPGSEWRDACWSVLCASISHWLSSRSGLPIDFQIQQFSHANATENGKRIPLGMYVEPTKDSHEQK